MKKKDIERIYDEFECEGFDRFFEGGWEDIKDPKFQTLYKIACAAREDLFDYLRNEATRNKIETDVELM
jgi:hypothetical protein